MSDTQYSKTRYVKHRLRAKMTFHLKDGVDLTVEQVKKLISILIKLGADMDITFSETMFSEKEMNLEFSYPPRLSIASIANVFKGVSSRLIKKEYPKEFPLNIWSREYTVSSCDQ